MKLTQKKNETAANETTNGFETRPSHKTFHYEQAMNALENIMSRSIFSALLPDYLEFT